MDFKEQLLLLADRVVKNKEAEERHETPRRGFERHLQGGAGTENNC